MTARARRALLLFLVAGFAIWASALSLLYGVQAVGCALGWHQAALGPTSLHRIVLLSIWLIHLAAIALLLVWIRRQAARRGEEIPAVPEFVLPAAWAATLSALAATAWTGAPVLAASTCA